MSSTTRFDHLRLINKSIRELYRALGAEHVKSYKHDFVLGDFATDIDREPIIATQRLAKRIAEHYRLPITTVIVVFRSDLKYPGHVELGQSNEFFVELQSHQRFFPKALAAILAHEIAHIFLHRCGIRFSQEFENEVLTDTTAAYVGLGAVILNAATETKDYPSQNVIRTNTHHFGYISLDEFGYILAKRDAALNHESLPNLGAGLPILAFESGRKQYRRELAARPLVDRPWYRRLLQPSNASLSHLMQLITFSCPYCSQALRVPELRKKLSVHCTTCHSRFAAYS